ncbi:BACON domain-containing carbohydrate-binding protein [Chitinophaga niabensis]|uniref:BACON domain-containing protein n=1 Tax=Chitinophaga niabensis TaxID=536979 RepID=UPI0031B9C842
MQRYILFLLILITACRKEEERRFSTELAVDSRIVRLNAAPDTTRIIVYADGDWKMETAEEADWITVQTASGSGKGDALVAVTDNADKLPRMMKLIVRSKGKTDTIQLQQRGLVPAIVINDTTAQSIVNGGILKTPITTNVPLAKMEVSYQYDATGQVNWISQLQITDGYLYFKVDTNKTTAERTAFLRLSYLDALGTTVKDSIRVKQYLGISYKDAVAKDFAYIKQTLAAGLVEENIYVEGIVVSDKGHPNIAKNQNSATNKHNLDKTENAISVYVQSPDGKSGLYFKTKTPGENIFNFNDRVKIWLKGTTLTKLSNPGRTVISGVTVTNIMQKDGQSTALLPREKYMNELTDEDLYTYVKLKDVELSIPFGAFTNINEGYTARMDCYPASIRDIRGNSMYMLTNLDVPYRRDGNAVPQGSGSITGIIVSETYERYGGNIGKYAIRHLKRSDIDLKADRNNGFSKVLVEWSRFKNEYAATPTLTANPLTPDTGDGKITQSARPAMDFTANGLYTTTDYNGLIQETATVKGAVTNGGWGSKNWWNTTTNKGEYWEIAVSTADISQPISLQIDGNVDIGGPRNFVVEWSDKNDATAVWSQVSTFTFEDVANFSNTLLTQVAGYKVLNFQFPQAASGLANLYIRLRVADKNAGTTTSPTGGTLTAATACRLVHVSIKYNK